ncbi:carboxyl-terminal protease [Arsukibacterium sp. MJ3]|uniref:S41 family peptidase n=1 Tax=Arsukibacterium sp. MJ3 TaxID=1632859 RepID=UPI0006272F48|nr:S41 family peptidase [Arsukibacterium sp. MJ3]KKO48637.1 carboxyl-terminal protease [Arsukibacterium sp. MJ3]
MNKLLILIFSMLLVGCGGSDSADNSPTNDIAECNRSDINSQLYCKLYADYLWYRELKTGVDPLAFSTPAAYLRQVIADRDRYSFVMTEQEYQDRYINAVFFGYGFATQRTDNNTALQVLYVFNAGSAAQQGLRRADKITQIDGISVAEWLSQLDAGTVTNDDIYGPNEEGVVRNFVWRKPNDTQQQADFVKGTVSTNTVMHRSVAAVGTKKVGYLVFNTFIELSETELEQAFSYFAAQDIDELVLDVRYNGGGLIRVANQLSSHIALARLQDNIFVKYRYNDKNTRKNSTVTFALGAGRTQLNLPRVFVLTTAGSCSSSELVINALSPFIDVVQIGETTCGKPVGQVPDRVGDFRLFAINFQTVNALDFGEYFTGLMPNCPVTATVTGDWGVSSDPLYAEAVAYIANGSCSLVAISDQNAQLYSRAEPIIEPNVEPVQPQWLRYNEQ